MASYKTANCITMGQIKYAVSFIKTQKNLAGKQPKISNVLTE
jgi:hypothetical protein